MPVYEYHCDKHGAFEVARSVADHKKREPCPHVDKDLEHGSYTQCFDFCDQVFLTAPSMQPDKYWSGHYIEALGKNFTSKSQLKEHLKRNNITHQESGLNEQIDQNAIDIQKRNDRDRRKSIEETYTAPITNLNLSNED